MSIRLKNTADDRSKSHLHRVATRLIQEPSLMGRRIRLNETITISLEDYVRNKQVIDGWVSQGVIEVLNAPIPLRNISVVIEPGKSIFRGLKEAEEVVSESLPRNSQPEILPVVEEATVVDNTSGFLPAISVPTTVESPIASKESSATAPSDKKLAKKKLI